MGRKRSTGWHGGRALILLALVVIAASCGSSLSREEILSVGGGSAGGAGLGADGTGAVGSDVGGDFAAGASGGAGGEGAITDVGGVGGDVPAGDAAGGAGPGAPGAPSAPGAGGAATGPAPAARPNVPLKASDKGITKDTITLGVVSGLTGAAGTQFVESAHTIDAFFKDLNQRGGLQGRRVVVKIIDDGIDAGRNASAHRSLEPQVFAFVGSLSIADSGSASVLRDTGVPDIGFALSTPRAQLPNHAFVTFQAGMKGQTTMTAEEAKRAGVTRMGFVYLNVDAAITEANAVKKAFESVGIPICYEAAIQLVEPDYTSYVQALQRNNCDGFYLVAQTNAGGKFQNTVYRQGYKPKMALHNIVTYERAFIEASGGPEALENAYLWFGQAPITQENLQKIPELNRFVTTLKRYYPNADPRKYAAAINWGNAKFFVEAFNKAGPNPTRQSFLAAARTIKNYDPGGLVAPTPDPFAKEVPPGTCGNMLKFQGSDWVQVRPAGGGYDCSSRVVK